MAHTASDGKQFTNRPPMMQHERSLAAKKPNPLQSPQAENQEPDGDESPEGVAQAHGAATEVHVQHDHEGGKHHVHSVHPDGHEHHSEHGSAEEAHDHGKSLAMSHGEPDGDEMGGDCGY